MATFKVEIVAGGTTYTVNKTVSAAHLTRLIAAMRIKLDRVNPALFTDDQVYVAWVQTIMDQAKADVKAVERQTAADAAVAPVTDIGFT